MKPPHSYRFFFGPWKQASVIEHSENSDHMYTEW